MARFLGNVSTPLTYKVNSQSALDPRVVADTKEELTKAETWPQSGESVYVYDGQIVYVKSEQCAYALVDKNNYTNVNSWKYVGGYEDIYAYDIKSEAIQDVSKIVADETLTFDMISNTTTVGGVCYDENYNYFYRTVQISGATGAVETQYYLTWGDLGDNIVTSEELGEVKDGKTYPKANTTYYCEYQDADGKQDFTIPSDFNGFVSGKLYISVLNGKMYKASSTNSLITVSGGDSSYLLNRLIALEKAGAEDDVLEFNGMVDTKDIVESSVAANNYTIMFDTHNKQFIAYENGVYYANWKENDFNKPSAAYGEKMYSGIKPTAGKIYIDISTNQIYRWNGVDLIALNATADSIKIGKNDDGNTYKIALNSDGSGHLANKGIEWNAEGDVTFGQNVTLNWSNIENPPTPPSGEGTFKSTVFTRNNTTPDTPTGGSYNNPKPDGNIWSDGIPDGDEILWASTRVFSTLGEDSELEQKAWTDPKKMTDTASFNVEFSKSETPKAPTDFIDGETEEQWRANNPDWENTSDEDTIWMATNTRKNGVWDGWQVSKIKGEKGDNGTSISIKKKANIVESIEKLPTPATIGDICFVGSIEDMDNVVSYVYQENDWAVQTGMQLGDSYLVDEWLFMWDGDSWIKSQFKGDPGKSSYIHIKYANSSNPGDWTGRGNEPSNSIIPDDKTSWGETPGAYMGVYSDNIETDSKNWNSYKWTKWEGQDGMGYEYVYRTTITNKAPELSENEYTKNEITYNPSNDGFIPENWSDDPISISSENPFCWMAVRQKLDGKWSSFKISLWSKWGSDSIKLDLDNDNDSIMYRDNTPISTVVSNATLYDGIYPVTDNIEYSVADWGTAEGSLDKNQITITSIGSSSTSVKIRAEYKENEYFATLSIKKLVNTDKYEIICSPNAIPHNIDEGDSQHTILVNTYKTNFETGVRELLTELPDGYALICNINDSNSGNDNVTIVNNQYILDITDTNKPDSLTFILKKGEEVLDSETIPVNYTKNGEKGADGKDGEDGVGVSSIKTQYAISNDPINRPDDANWEDNSPAVNKDSQYLWQRLKTIYTNNTESAWSYNVVGRMGEKGIDGDSVEYVYSRTNENKAPQKPTGTEPIENNNGTWTDDPQGVSDTNKYEWISEHKKVGGVWQEYSEPSLWAKWGEDGISPNSAFKSTVFTRTNETPSLPTGGSYDNPKPDGDIWTDGIPDGEEILWASTRIFSTDGKAPQQAKWTDPRKMTDTSDFDVEYSSKESPNKPSGHPNTNTDDWSNTANEETIWMATSTCKNGVWSDWKVSKIKGEKGEDGQSIKVAGHYKDLAAFEAIWKKDGQWVAPENTSDCYVVGTNLYVWDGDSWEDVGPFKGDKGEKGDTYILYVRYSASPNGTDMSTVPNKYIGVASSKETTAPTSPSDYTWTKWKGDDGYGYDYIYIRTKSSDTEDVPALPNIDNWENDQDYQKDTYIPENWSDDPQDVDKDNPYCWMCYRQKVDGVWQQYKGSATNPGKPSLWTRWAKDGAGIESVTRKYLITADTDEDGNDITIEKIKELYGPTNAAWQLNSPTVTPDQPLLVEWIHTEYTSGGADEDYAFIGRMGEKGIDGSLIEYIYILTKTTDEIPTVPENGSESINTNNKEEWTDDPQSIDSTFKYQWISEREFDRANNKWGDYSNPVLWSIWAEDGKPGQNSIKIDLDNDNDSMLYDGAGNCISGDIIVTPTLYDGVDKQTPTKWEVISGESNTENYEFNSNTGVLTVKGITDNNALYTIKATYNQKEYIAVFSVKKLINADKYELVITPNAFTYNVSTKTASDDKMTILVYRTSQTGRELVKSLEEFGLELWFDNAQGESTDYNDSGLEVIPDLEYSDSIEVILYGSDNSELDAETIPINKSKNGENGKDGAAGANAIRLDLDNENDSMLYDGSGNCVSGAVTSRARLYDGDKEVAASDVTWVISGCKGVNLVGGGAAQDADYTNKGATNAWITVEGKITINGVNESTSYVQVRATYQDNHYYTTLSIKKLVNADKYELKVTPNAIAYNSSTSLPKTVKLTAMVYKTTVDKPLPTLSDLPSGYGVFVISESMNGYNMNKPDATVGTYETEILIEDYLSDGAVQIFIGKSPNISAGILDIETIPINKSKNGTNGKDGENGENAITYEIVPDISYFTKAADNSSASGRIGGFVYKIDGNSRTRITSTTLVQYPWGNVASGKLYIAAGYCDDNGNFSFIHNPLVDSGKEDASKNGRFDTGSYFTDITTATTDNNKKGVLSSNSITLELRDSNNEILASFNVSAAKNGMAGESKSSAPLRVSEWSAGTTYYKGDEAEAPWSDTVHYNGKYYRCILQHGADQSNNPEITSKPAVWQEFDGQFQSIATGLLLAENAYVNLLSGNTINIKDSSGNITAGMSGGDGIQLWAGGQQETANFRVEKDGDVHIKGAITYDTTPEELYVDESGGEPTLRTKDCYVIDMAKTKSLTINSGEKLVLFPQQNEVTLWNGEVMSPYTTRGTKITISRAFDYNVGNWPSWRSYDSSYDYSAWKNPNALYRLLQSATLLCADGRIFSDPGIPIVEDNWTWAGDSDRFDGCFVINGRLAKFLLILPGQTVTFTSGYYRTDMGYTWDENNGISISEKGHLVWCLDNPQDFEPIYQKVETRQGTDSFQGPAISASSWGINPDRSESMWAPAPLNEARYAFSSGTIIMSLIDKQFLNQVGPRWWVSTGNQFDPGSTVTQSWLNQYKKGESHWLNAWRPASMTETYLDSQYVSK